MRHECQGLWLICDNGDREPVTSGLAMEVIRSQPEFYTFEECGKPAVDSVFGVMTVNGAPASVELHLCAEHWDFQSEVNRGL